MIWPFSRRRRATALLVQQHNEFMQALSKADAHVDEVLQLVAKMREHTDMLHRSIVALGQQVANNNVVAVSASTAAGAAYEIALAAQRYCVSVHEKEERWVQHENLQALEEVIKRYETGVRVQ
jgi:hypothetical protein